jgi:tripartite ATP-independent transporter DctM subunit
VSIGALFMGGVAPGALIGLFMMGYTYVQALKHGYPAIPFPGFHAAGKALQHGAAPLMIPVLVLGGIVGGFFTPTEGGVIALLWALFLSLIIYRDIPLRAMPRILVDGAIDFAIPLFTVAAAGIFGWMISYLGAAQIVVEFILGVTSNGFLIMLMLIGFLLLVGMVLNPISATLIFLPIIQSLGTTAGINPVHMGVLSTIVLSVGLITPPYGICLLIAAQIGDVPLSRAMVAAAPICLLTISVAITSIWVPGIVLWLPKLLVPELF